MPIMVQVDELEPGRLFRSLKTRRDLRLIKTAGLGGDPVTKEVLLWNYVFQAGGHAGAIGWASNSAMVLSPN